MPCTDDRCTGGRCAHALDDTRCDDRVACTDDTCAETGCRNMIVPARCLSGQTCDPRMGCTGGRVCAGDRDCVDTDPCTVNERCDSAARVCRTDSLDGDGDHHAPRVCGGDDCDDGNAQVFLGAAERCNGVDDDCDGIVDGVAAMLACASGGSGRICAGGACSCETPGRIFCGGTCRDLATDMANCGSCGNACGPMSRCLAGRCECVAGASACSGACVNLANDPTHCGTCTTSCPSSSNCTGGACVCTGTATLCGGRCVELLSDGTNCGACGRACSTGFVCRAGACQCDVGRTLCGSACVDLSADRANCGRCGGACGPAAACDAGACACNSAGLTWCAGSCSSLSNDTANCGRCGNVCRTGEMCLAGVCSAPVIEGPACEMAPSTASSRIVFDGLTGARDFAFDGRGGVAVAQGSTVVMRRGSDSTPITMVMPGAVVALRYTRTAGLVLAVFNNTGMGTSNGAIYQVAPGATTATVRQGGLRQPGGLAVDADNNVWFSDTAAPVADGGTRFGLVYRMPADPGGEAARVVVTDVPSPTHLLVDAAGRYLFVARSDTNTLMRVALAPAGGGAIGAAMEFVGGFSRVSGLAQDECGNVYVADEIVDRIWRLPILAGVSVRVVTDVRGPRSLMFGVGDPFGPRELYALSSMDGTLRAANVVVRGVPLVVPAP